MGTDALSAGVAVVKDTQPAKSNPLAIVAGVAAAAVSWSLTYYSGASLLVPLVGMALFFIAFTRVKSRAKYFRVAISITGGHLLWFIVAAMMLGAWGPVFLDLIFLSAGVVWLWLRPGPAPAIFLGVVQSISLAINVTSLSSARFGTVPHRALVVHCLLRAIAIVAIVAGYRLMRRDDRAVDGQLASIAPPAPPIPPAPPVPPAEQPAPPAAVDQPAGESPPSR
jgi:hypothetical protein